MEKIIREILVLPLRLLLLVSRFVPIVDRYTLVKWIWKVARSDKSGFELVMETVDRFGLQAGRDLAHGILNETKSAIIAFGIAHSERLENNYQAAKEWIDFAEEMGCEDCYHLLSVKLGISHMIEDYDHDEIVEEMLACNYLPMEYTYQALINKAFLLFKEDQHQKAEKIVDHILRIKNDQISENLKAIILLARKEDVLAKKLLAKSKKHLSELEYSLNVAQAYVSASRPDESIEWLYIAVCEGYDCSEGHPVFKNIIESDEFTNYCVARN